jgi:hypothetical protein
VSSSPRAYLLPKQLILRVQWKGLSWLMGIASRTVRIPKIDSDYFDEEAT